MLFLMSIASLVQRVLLMTIVTNNFRKRKLDFLFFGLQRKRGNAIVVFKSGMRR